MTEPRGEQSPDADLQLLRDIPDPRDRVLAAKVYLDLIELWGSRTRALRDDALMELLSQGSEAGGRTVSAVARELRLSTTLVKETPQRVARRELDRLREFGDRQAGLVNGEMP